MLKTCVDEFKFAADPIELFNDLSLGGTLPNTLLLESADITTRHNEKSIIVAKASLKAVCRGTEVVVTALNPTGQQALIELCEQLPKYLTQKNSTEAKFQFSKPNHDVNLSDRLTQASPFDVIRSMTTGFSAGVFSYDLIDWVEDLPKAKEDSLNFPDYTFWSADVLIVIDHQKQTTSITQGFSLPSQKESSCQVTQHPHNPFDLTASDLSDTSDAEFSDIVTRLKKHILAGDVFQIVPSRSFQLPCPSPLLAYQHLRSFNPSPYMYYVVDDNWTLFGASPETYIRVDAESRTVDIRPIAGTRRRGFNTKGQLDPELDSRREAELRLDEKELAEHMMLVDLARNDIARVSETRTRYVDELLTVDRYSHVMHLVSCVKGKLKKELDGLHAYQASMNMGTLVGAPKVKAAEILRQTEKTKRGFYGGAVGYFDRDGNMDTAITIRSALVRDGVAHVRAGAGVVYDSVAEHETQETKNKAEAVLRAIAMSNTKQAQT